MNNYSSPHRLIRALLCQPVDVTPIWLMRQAGRYLPEYRATRAKAGDFLTLCKTPELACEVTLQPLKRFALDGAILFSDILTIPDAMGLGLYFTEGEGPKFQRPIQTAKDIEKLGIPDPEQELRYVIDAVKLIKHALADRLPLIGFAGSPWTLAAYMIEGKSSKDFRKAKELLYGSPSLMHLLLEKLAESITLYLNAQIAAGANAVMLFDTWGGLLTTSAYEIFSLNYLTKIITKLHRQHQNQRIPCIIFTKNGGQWLPMMVSSGSDAIGIDWTTDIGIARSQVPAHIALQGNLDPTILYSNADCINLEVAKILSRYGKQPGHVFNLGHGILPDVPFENVTILVDAVKNLSKAYHD